MPTAFNITNLTTAIISTINNGNLTPAGGIWIGIMPQNKVFPKTRLNIISTTIEPTLSYVNRITTYVIGLQTFDVSAENASLINYNYNNLLQNNTLGNVTFSSRQIGEELNTEGQIPSNPMIYMNELLFEFRCFS